jgi:predicted SnoaL-like aldol condensation-catalyzing enzyme
MSEAASSRQPKRCSASPSPSDQEIQRGSLRWYGPGMDLVAFLDDYINEIYVARDAQAARRFIADPCLRHEHGELLIMSMEQNIERITAFLHKHPDLTFVNRCVIADDAHVVTCYDATLENGRTISGVEVFKVVDGKVTETWNGMPGTGAWG